jgi:signal transduction histidine kinase
MDLFFNQIFTFLTVSPGTLLYHIVLAFSIAGALQGAIHQWRTSGFPQGRRTVTGLAVLLGLQGVLFLVSLLVGRGLISAGGILPPLDRAISLISIVWIAWLWAFPEPVRLADAASILLSLLGVAFFALSCVFNAASANGDFNLSVLDFIWQLLCIGVVILGLLGLVLRRPNGWGNGLAMLVLAFLGHLCTLIWPMTGDYPGFLRLAHLALFPILLTLAQRFASPGVPVRKVDTTVATGEEAADAQSARKERRRYSTDPKTFQSLIRLAGESSTEKICQQLTRGIAQAMLADLCFLLTLGKDKNLTITCGYDLIREECLGGTMVDKDAIPLLANAIQRGRPLRLPASSTSSDLKGLGQVLGLSNPGHLLSVPITSAERGAVGGLLILSPYSNRLWNADDQTYLTSVSNYLLPVLERGKYVANLLTERDDARRELESLAQVNSELKNRIEQGGLGLQGSAENAAQLTALLATQTEAQKTIEQLRSENERLLALTGSLPGSEQLEHDLRQTLEEMAHMQNSVAEANQKILELENRPEVPITNEQVEVIASISQDLRQPMSSIVGYTDLLLGESVGILGALQRKFVERIKASTERIGGLLDDLIQITNLDTGNMEFTPEQIDLNLIIDNAMAYTSTQIREKNITLRLDIPDTSPQVQTDRDALQQILIHLLQNATAVTQLEGTITLRVQLQAEQDNLFLSIQVKDTGGGISGDDMARVFARRYRAEHSLIDGVGDTGVGLSIAKSLVEAQNGRIWVETEAEVGSTFSVLLPVLPVETEG